MLAPAHWRNISSLPLCSYAFLVGVIEIRVTFVLNRRVDPHGQEDSEKERKATETQAVARILSFERQSPCLCSVERSCLSAETM